MTPLVLITLTAAKHRGTVSERDVSFVFLVSFPEIIVLFAVIYFYLYRGIAVHVYNNIDKVPPLEDCLEAELFT